MSIKFSPAYPVVGDSVTITADAGSLRKVETTKLVVDGVAYEDTGEVKGSSAQVSHLAVKKKGYLSAVAYYHYAKSEGWPDDSEKGDCEVTAPDDTK